MKILILYYCFYSDERNNSNCWRDEYSWARENGLTFSRVCFFGKKTCEWLVSGEFLRDYWLAVN